MKRNPAIAIIMCLLVSFTFSACAPAAPSGQTPEFFHDIGKTLSELKKEGYVPASTFFAYDRERDILVGAVDIRHSLNEALLLDGGHIGDGVRPSERRKGYATAMIALALDECRKLGIEKVLMVCNKENTGSAKSIQNNGGVLENEINVEGETVQRYWIQL